jgi:hypothetical protein
MLLIFTTAVFCITVANNEEALFTFYLQLDRINKFHNLKI